MPDVLQELITKHAASAQPKANEAQPRTDFLSDLAAQQAEREAAGGAAAGDVSAAKEFGRSVGEGVTGLPDIAPTIAGAIWNAPAWLRNRYKTTVIDPSRPDQPPSRLESLDPVPQPFHETYNQYFPPDPNHPEARKAGNLAGSLLPAIVAPPLLTGDLPGMALATGLDLPVTVGASYAGGKGGRAIDLALGGSGDVGEAIGQGAGGLITPGTFGAGSRLLNRLYTDNTSREKLADAILSDTPVSLGLVGNKTAGRLEDYTAGIGGAGGPATRTRRAQYEAFDRNAREAADSARPPGYDVNTPIASPGDIGSTVKRAAIEADQNAAAEANATFNPLSEQVGRNTVLDTGPQRQSLRDIREGRAPAVGDPGRATADPNLERPTLDVHESLLDVNRRNPLYPGQPKVIDVADEAQLQTRLARATNDLATAQAAGPQGETVANILRQNIATIQRQIDDNRGVTWADQLRLRSATIPREAAPYYSRNLENEIHGLQTDTLRQGALDAGVNPTIFDWANLKYGRLQDTRRDVLQPIAEADTGEAYRKVFSGTNAQNQTALEALHTNAPETTQQALADNFEYRTRGPSAGQPTPNPETIKPKTASAWWQTQPEYAQDLTLGPLGDPQRERWEATTRLMQADATRGTRTLPTGGTSLGGPISTFVAPVALAAGGGNPLSRMWRAAVPTVLGQTVGRSFTSPSFTQAVVNPGPWMTQYDLGRLLSGAVTSDPNAPQNQP
jgi:hypothetical protein